MKTCGETSAMGVWIIIGLLAIIPLGCSDSDSTSLPPVNLQERVNLLFAESGTLAPLAAGMDAAAHDDNDQPRKYTLTLENVSEEVLWYVERPGRESGSETVQKFIALWSGMYGSVSPNAVLDGYVRGEISHEGLFLILEKPSYDSTKGHLQFQATLLDTTVKDMPFDSPLQVDDIKITVLDNSPEDETDNWSFAQVAPHAFFEKTQAEGVYKLYLDNVYPESYYLGNAPNRRSYLYTVECLAINWREVFGDDPPNASLTSYTEDGKLNVHMLTIDNPEYDKDTHSVIYTATLLHGVVEGHQALYSSTLFIEGMETSYEASNPSTLSTDQANAATHTITVTNNCTQTVWLGACGNCMKKESPCTKYFDPPNGANVELGTKHNAVFHVDKGWQGRFWPRTGCVFDDTGVCKNGGVNCCASGGCLNKDHKFAKNCYYGGQPPVIVIEPTFDAPSGLGPIDYFDSSMVDGYNALMSIAAKANTYNKDPDPGMKKEYWCTIAGCNSSPTCPAFLLDSHKNCWSPCQYAVQNKLSTDERERLCCVCSTTTPCTCPADCCDGHYGCSPYTPEGKAHPNMCCDPWGKLNNNRPWDEKYRKYIDNVKKACPEVYAWQFDDFKSTINCRKTNGLVDYQLTICP